MNAEEILVAAVEKKTPAERVAYLDGACGSDAALRSLVEGLLRSHEAAGSFLEQPLFEPSPTLDQPPHSEKPSTVIGPYKLLQQIGEGGMGVVYMAEQTHPVQRKVALKLIKAGMDSKQVSARFEAERQALALMDHPNIARVFDGGATADGRPYFVMELVKGVPITEYCDEHRLTPRQRLELFLPVCQAVQHAHQKGIIHRDLKPSNVTVCLYDDKPVPKVIDFGIAKATGPKLTEHTLFTEFGAVVGTLEYMSPEQARLNQLDIDTRSDIYALGVLLYELLTGTTPLERKRLQGTGLLELLRLIREEEPPKPSTRLRTAETLPAIAANRGLEPRKLSGQLRGELDWIVMMALEKDRDRRYQTPHSLALDIQRYLHDETVLACPPSAGYRLSKFARRHKAGFVAAVGVVLAVLLVVAGLALSNLRIQQAQQRTEDALGDARREERAKSEQLWQALVAEARAIRLSHRPGQRIESLEILERATELARTLDLPPDKFHELRNAVTATLALPDLHLAGPWCTWPADTPGFDFDEAHAVYARTDRQGTCSIRRVADDAEIHRLKGLGAPAWVQLSRDAKFAAVTHATTPWEMRLWQLDGVTPRLLLSEKPASGAVDFHPNGRQVALPYADGAIGLFELPSGRPLGRLAPDIPTREVNIALHPTEPVVAVSSYFGPVVQLRDLRTGLVVASLPPPARPTGVAWSPDGRTLAVGYVESNVVHLYDRTTLQPYRTLEGAGAGVDLTFNHAGDRLATTAWGGAVALFDVGTGQKLFTTTVGSSTRRFSRDDRRLAGAVQDGKVGIWQVGDSRENRTLVRKDLPAKINYHLAAIHPDGRLLAVSMGDGFGLWDLATGSELAFIARGVVVADLRFEPSGALLTADLSGVFRWPIRADPGSPDRLVVGPPERLPLRVARIGQNRDGRVIVGCARPVGGWEADAGGWILHSDRPQQPIRLDAGADIGWVAVSPDGRWVVTVPHPAGVAKVWDARDGRLVEQLPGWATGTPRFSPDSLWLSIPREDGRLLAVGTWEPGPKVGGGGVYAPDGKLMALDIKDEVIRLVDAATGREIARLEGPQDDLLAWMGFTPDGTRLVMTGGRTRAIHVWDLRAIRRELKARGLDWDWPEFPPTSEEKDVSPLHVTMDLGSLAPASPPAAAMSPQMLQETIVNYSLAIAFMPLNPEAYLRRGWAYYQLKQWRQAADDLGLALALLPGNTDSEAWFELGYACVESGRPKEAFAAYSRCIELNPNGPGAWNNRGMLYEKRGEPDKALADFSKALALNPQNDLAWNNRSRVHASLGRWEETVEDCTRFLALVQAARQPEAYYRRAAAYVQLRRYREAQADYQKLLELAPASALVHNDLSWLLATCPDPKERDVARAVELARRAVELQEQVGNVWNTLGVAHYRAGNWKAAVEALDRSRALRQGGDAFDFFFLAMAHWRLGHKEEARKWHQQAVEWVKQNQEALAKDRAHAEELKRFGAEAAELLVIDAK
jgi:serine/threonine protein kinase/tetratricopeptide (TPR) repeat protein/WD40 repeat protein